MAAIAPNSDQAIDMMKNLSLDSPSKTLDVTETAKKPSVESVANGNGQSQPLDRSLSPLIPDYMDPAVAYFPNGYTSPAYYYGAYDGSTKDYEDYSIYMNPDGVDMLYGVYGDNSLMYPGYGYTPYGPYSPAGSPVPPAGQDGQLYGGQHYQYPSPYFPTVTQNTVPPKKDNSKVAVASQRPLSVDTANRFPNTANSHLVSPRPLSAINAASGYMNRMYSNKFYGQYRGAYGSGFGFGSNSYCSQNKGNSWMTVDNKYRPRGRSNGFFGYNNENSDGLNELNRGPRAGIVKNQMVQTQVASTVKGQNGNLSNVDVVEKDAVCAAVDREQYNKKEFPDTYADAKFFVIKSYSEDDVHKSIKYNVWSSTQNGNKKLDAAFQEAQQKSPPCPVFLLFSVNTSGQFVGIAEMTGAVDFKKSLEYWQQDKWIGCFPVKWHIVKDVPNSLLKHITLEYNENKPVTNSRDIQEVKLEQGLQLVKIFKEHSSTQCILDDFEFYEDRQKRIQEKKAKQQQFLKSASIDKNITPELVKETAKLAENGQAVGNKVINGC